MSPEQAETNRIEQYIRKHHRDNGQHVKGSQYCMHIRVNPERVQRIEYMVILGHKVNMHGVQYNMILVIKIGQPYPYGKAA